MDERSIKIGGAKNKMKYVLGESHTDKHVPQSRPEKKKFYSLAKKSL